MERIALATRVAPGPYYTAIARMGLGRIYRLRGEPDSAARYFTAAATSGGSLLPTVLNYLGGLDLDVGAINSAFTGNGVRSTHFGSNRRYRASGESR